MREDGESVADFLVALKARYDALAIELGVDPMSLTRFYAVRIEGVRATRG
jgi:hypothetical protein